MIPLTQPTIAENTREAVERVVKSNFFSPGAEVRLFEGEWADYCGMKHGVATNSGTTAIEVAAKALTIGNRDAVLIPAFTCIPVAVPFLHAGVDIYLADCGDDGNVTVESVSKAIEAHPHIGAVVLVHTYGNPVSQRVFDLCREKGKLILEDCCEAHGVMPQGDVAVFSFRGDKMITSGGTGGMVVTNDDNMAAYMREYVMLGLVKSQEYRYDAVCIGNGIQMSELQAAFGRCQIPMLDKLISGRRRVASIYDNELRILKPSPRPYKSVVWRYMARYEGSRTTLIRKLRDEGVEAMASFRSLSQLLGGLTGKQYDYCPKAEEIGDRNVCLPVWGDMPEGTVDTVMRKVELVG